MEALSRDPNSDLQRRGSGGLLLPSALAFNTQGHSYSNLNTSGDSRVHFGNTYQVYYGPHETGVGGAPFTVPFDLDSNFISRGTVLQRLQENLRPGRHSRIALAGMGGVGKTQLAVQFAHNYREHNPTHAVYWLYAANEERVRDSLRIIATAAKLRDAESPNVNLEDLAKRYLSDHRNGPWLLIVDNADDLSAADSLQRLLPQTSGCTVLLTTRDERVAIGLVSNWSQTVTVDIMEPEEAIELLKKKWCIDRLKQDDQRLLEELGFLPLAITQAAAYMSRYKISSTKYLEFLRKQPDIAIYDPTRGQGLFDTRRDPQQINAVYATLAISFSKLEEEDPTAATLLKIMSCYDRQNIPSEIFHTWISKPFLEGNSVHQYGQYIREELRISAAEAHLGDEDMEKLLSLPPGESSSEHATPAFKTFANDFHAQEISSKNRQSERYPQTEPPFYSPPLLETTEHRFAESIGTLLALALIRENSTSEAYSLHRLVQMAVKHWIKQSQDVERITNMAGSLLWFDIMGGARSYALWADTFALASHLQSLAEYMVYEVNINCLHTRGLILFAQGEHMETSQGKGSGSKFLKESVKCLQNSRLKCRLIVLYAMKVTAESLDESDEAEFLLRELLKREIKIFGFRHPNTVNSIHQLVDLLCDKSFRDNRNAEHLIRHVIAVHAGFEDLADEGQNLQNARSLFRLACVLQWRVMFWEDYCKAFPTHALRHTKSSTIAEGLTVARRTIALLERSPSRDLANMWIFGFWVGAYSTLASLEEQQGLYTDAEQDYCRAACAMLAHPVYGEKHEWTKDYLMLLNQNLLNQGRAEISLQNFKEQHAGCTWERCGCLLDV